MFNLIENKLFLCAITLCGIINEYITKIVRFSAIGAVTISKVMMVNHSLQKLGIGFNNIGDDGISAIAGALGNCKIRELNAMECSITLAGTKSLAVGLSSNHTIKVLWLQDNPISVEGALLINSAVVNTNCRYVGINNEYKSDKAIAKANLKSRWMQLPEVRGYVMM